MLDILAASSGTWPQRGGGGGAKTTQCMDLRRSGFRSSFGSSRRTRQMRSRALAATIGEAGGQVSAVDTRTVGRTSTVRDVTITVSGDAVRRPFGRPSPARGHPVISVSDSSLSRAPGRQGSGWTQDPGQNARRPLDRVHARGRAGRMAVAEGPSKAFQLTIKRNTVAVISDGTAVLGLGDIGPLGALPVMEGKCMLFKQFAGIDAFPIFRHQGCRRDRRGLPPHRTRRRRRRSAPEFHRPRSRAGERRRAAPPPRARPAVHPREIRHRNARRRTTLRAAPAATTTGAAPQWPVHRRSDARRTRCAGGCRRAAGGAGRFSVRNIFRLVASGCSRFSTCGSS